MNKSDINEKTQIASEFDFGEVLKDYKIMYEKTDAEAQAVLEELKKWLILCAINSDNEYTMVGSVDELWHIFILHTHKYHDFCEKIAGRYLHHVPDVEQKRVSKKEKSKKDNQSLVNGKLEFLTLPDETIARYRNLLHDLDEMFDDGFNPGLWPTILPNGRVECEGGCCKNSCGGCVGGGSCKT